MRHTGDTELRDGAWVTAATRWAAAAALAWLVVRLSFGGQAITQDQSWLLYAARQMLHGVPLYGSQLTETNPPLIIWLSAVPAAVAQMLGVGSPAVFYPIVTACLAGSVLWCYALLGGVAEEISRGKKMLLAGCILAAEVFLHLGDFGQREHLLVLFVMPYLVAFGLPRRQALGTVQTVLLAVVAAVGTCIKPQQVLLLLAFQAAIVVSRRTWRRPGDEVNVGIAVTFGVYAMYAAAVVLFAPHYVKDELPLLMNAYWAFGRYSALQLALMDKPFLLLVALGAVLYAALRRRGVTSFGPLLLLASVASSVAFDVQHTGFNYQWIPQNALALLALLWMLAEAMGKRFPAWVDALGLRRKDAVVFAVAVLAFAGLAMRHHRAAGAMVPKSGTLEEFYAGLPAGTPVMALSTNPQALFPSVEQNRLMLASRFVHLWMLPAVEQNEYLGGGARKVLAPEVRERLAAVQRAQVTEDLVERKPQYVLVARCPSPLCEAIADPGFDVLRWLKKDAGFARAWGRYRPVQRLRAEAGGMVDVYVLRAAL